MARKRIFVAADDQLATALATPLRRSGLTIETFSRQADLLPAARIDPPDAMLLAMRLADGTALATYQALQGVGPPPTVVLLPNTQLSARAELLEAGISDVVVSPVKPRLLAARLAEVAGGVRRAEIRERIALPVVVEIKDRKIGGVTIDLSREGLGLSLWEPVQEGSIVAVNVTGKGGAVRVFGRVLRARKEGDRVQVGVRLVGLVTEEENALLKLARNAE